MDQVVLVLHRCLLFLLVCFQVFTAALMSKLFPVSPFAPSLWRHNIYCLGYCSPSFSLLRKHFRKVCLLWLLPQSSHSLYFFVLFF